MPRSGEIGEKIYEDVEKLVAQGMNRTEAFAKISADTGRRAGTVAANYYRVARKRAGGSLRKTRTRTSTTTRRAAGSARRGTRRAASSASGDIDAIVDDLVKNVQALAAAVKANSVENKELRSRLDGVKKMLG
jgi:outer membrane murein-binding lipoprotein Lpp